MLTRRFRLLLAPLVTVLLLVQMVMPGVMAQDATPAADAPVGSTVPAPPENLDEILPPEEPGQGETDAPVLPGETTEEGTQADVGDAGSDVEVDDPALTEDTASADDPEQDVVQGPMQTTDIRPMAVIGPGLTGVTVAPAVLADVCDKVRMDITWAVDDAAQGGDTFSFTIDSRLNVPNGVIPLAAPGGGGLVGNMRIQGSVATVILTDYVNTRNNVNGTAWFESSSCWAENFQGTTVDLAFTGSQTFTVPVQVPVRPAPPTPAPGTNPTKRGAFTRADQGRENPTQAIKWTITAPSGPAKGVTITDTAGANWTFVCSTFTNVRGTLVGTPVCDGTSLSVTYGEYGQGNNARPEFTIEATITGTMNPEQLATFANTARAVTLNMDGEPLPEGSGSATLPQTTPPPTPAPGTNPSKSGSFTRADQGRENPTQAIRWTITAPSGPAGGVTITDTAGANWTFVCGSFRNVRGTLAGEIQCSETSLTVTYGAYGQGTNARPQFTIEATITGEMPSDPEQLLTFTNTARAVTVNMDGQPQPEGSGSANLPQTGPTPTPTPGVTPDKSGAFTDSEDQGVFEPENAIRWTVTAPPGPAGGITITDTSGANWAFECDTIQWLNGIEPTSVDCSGNEVVVTFGPYASAENPWWPRPGFTIEASITSPASTTAKTFTNTVTTVVNGWEGGGEFGRGERTSTFQQSFAGGGGGVGDNVRQPVTPSIDVESNVCDGSTYIPPRVVVNDPDSGLTYTIGDVNLETGEYTVTATLGQDQTWGDMPEGWQLNPENTSEAVFNGQLEIPTCVKEVIPEAPEVDGNVCEGGVYAAPAIALATTPEGVTYAIVQDVDQIGAYIVSATVGEGFTWGNLDVTGWIVDPEDATRATYSDSVELRPCVPVQPVTPEVRDNVCQGGVYTGPRIVLATTPEGITYAIVQDVDGNGAYIVTATLGDGQAWGAMPEGWSRTSDSVATFNGSVQLRPCVPVVPVAPTVDGNVCRGGEYTEPALRLATAPEGITYAITQGIDENGSFVVTATLSDGQAWPAQMPEGWARTSNTVATYNGTVDLKPCVEAIPVLPDVIEAVCTGGELVPPTVTPVATTGIAYTIQGGVAPGATVIVTATLGDGYEWPAGMPKGWTEINLTTAIARITLDDVECEEVIPAAPIVSNAVCDFGGVTEPEITLQETNGVEYELDGDIAPGETVVVTATLGDGKAWGKMPEGWTRVNSTTATYEIVLDDPECITAIPVNPTVNQAVCTGGGIVDPIVTTPTADGIRYTFNENDVTNGGTVVVTATVQTGYAWPDAMPDGWTRVDAMTATFTVELEEVECEPVSPVLPQVTGNVCMAGIYTPATIVVDDPESGLVYLVGTVDPETGAYTVTATLGDGQAWDEMPEGWTVVNPTTARFDGTVDLQPCTTVVPVNPTVIPAVCESGKVIDPVVTLPQTPGVTYTRDNTAVPGGTVTVTATLADGYAWGEMPEGWTQVSTTTATFILALDSATCTSPDAPSKPTTGEVKVSKLPETGAGPVDGMSDVIALVIAAGTLALGAAALRLRTGMTGR